MRPDRIIIGATSDESVAVMRRLYAPFNRNHDRVVEMDVRSAELTKYAANAMLATKISFMNEIANIAERVGADVEQVRRASARTRALAGTSSTRAPATAARASRRTCRHCTAQQHGLEPKLLNAVEAVNDAQKGHLFALIQRHYDKGEDEGVRGKTFAVWGLAFKPNTDDMREASSRRLLAQPEGGATVRAYDPEAMHESQRIFGERDDLVFCSNADEALQGADALVVVTEWKQFRSPDFQKLREQLKDAVVFDGRNPMSRPKWKPPAWRTTASAGAFAACLIYRPNASRRWKRAWSSWRCACPSRNRRWPS